MSSCQLRLRGGDTGKQVSTSIHGSLSSIGVSPAMILSQCLACWLFGDDGDCEWNRSHQGSICFPFRRSLGFVIVCDAVFSFEIVKDTARGKCAIYGLKAVAARDEENEEDRHK